MKFIEEREAKHKKPSRMQDTGSASRPSRKKGREGARKDVECAFGILQSRFSILKRSARLYDQGDLQNVMLACIIFHNMVIEDEIDKDLEDITLV